MGVWIETETRNLKYEDINVTPCMGVWIETVEASLSTPALRVTPCMGVWIETTLSKCSRLQVKSHTLYGCVD